MNWEQQIKIQIETQLLDALDTLTQQKHNIKLKPQEWDDADSLQLLKDLTELDNIEAIPQKTKNKEARNLYKNVFNCRAQEKLEEIKKKKIDLPHKGIPQFLATYYTAFLHKEQNLPNKKQFDAALTELEKSGSFDALLAWCGWVADNDKNWNWLGIQIRYLHARFSDIIYENW